ncbi:MAG: segregation/condensation protein A [Candidatus Micrarchaeia archaeon]
MGNLMQIQIETKESKIDLEKLVGEATWKDLLVELVKKNKLDPWNVDILEIVDRYIEAVKEFKTMDLRVPANIILAASILLHFKSDALYYEIEGESDEENEVETVQRAIPEIPPLSFRLRIPPKRKITLNELIGALEEAMKLKEIREQKKNETVNFPIKFESRDIELELNNFFEEIMAKADGNGMTTFSNIMANKKEKDPLVEIFIPLLYLTHRGKITLMQEVFFGEIIIAVIEWKSKTTKNS